MNSVAVSKLLITLALAGVLGVTYTPTEGGGMLTGALRYFFIGVSLLPLVLSPGSCRIQARQLVWALLLGSYLILVNIGSTVQTMFAMVWIFLASVVFVSVWSAESRRTILINALDIVIVTFIAFLVLQAMYYGLTGVMVDFHNLLFPFSQARLFQTQDSLWRFTGHQIEPGTYANWMYALVLLRALASGNLFSRISFAGVASILITTSFWGVFAVIFFVLAYLLRKNKPSPTAKTYFFPLVLYWFNYLELMSLVTFLGDWRLATSRRVKKLPHFRALEKIGQITFWWGSHSTMIFAQAVHQDRMQEFY